MRNRWAFKDLHYDMFENYDVHKDSVIVRMSSTCLHLKLLMWPGEPVGLCCSNRKVCLSSVLDSLQPLKSLLFGEYSHFMNRLPTYNPEFRISCGHNMIKHQHFNPIIQRDTY